MTNKYKGAFALAYILSIGTSTPPYRYSQTKTKQFVHELFHSKYPKIERLLTVFENAQIHERFFSAPLEWFKTNHSFANKNKRYTELAIELGCAAIEKTVKTLSIRYEEIDAIFFISSTGISTPSIEAKIMNQLPFHKHVKRIPIWGLGCAGGAAGLARANEYCKAYPNANVLVLCVELCSLTFQKEDISKSNIIGTSLFADGVAACLVCGENSNLLQVTKQKTLPKIIDHQSTFMPHSEDVMGWDVKDTGLHVIFSKDIPTIITNWLKPNIESFLDQHQLTKEHLYYWIAHPGGKKVLEAYSQSLQLPDDKLRHSANILKHYGNMSSATVLFVLKEILNSAVNANQYGLLFALGPGFSSEFVLLKWVAI